MDNPSAQSGEFSEIPALVELPLRTFLTIKTLPLEWKEFDLYLIREGEIVIYVGQSDCAFQRVWQHIYGGPHGHSIVGRLVLVNWPRSGQWTVELHRSDTPRFAPAHFSRDAAEQVLIETYRPCLNISLNRQPTPLPQGCLPVNSPLRPFHSFKRMLREAAYQPRRASPDDLEWK